MDDDSPSVHIDPSSRARIVRVWDSSDRGTFPGQAWRNVPVVRIAQGSHSTNEEGVGVMPKRSSSAVHKSRMQ